MTVSQLAILLLLCTQFAAFDNAESFTKESLQLGKTIFLGGISLGSSLVFWSHRAGGSQPGPLTNALWQSESP